MVFDIWFLELRLDLNNKKIFMMICSIFISLDQAHGIGEND